MSAESDSDTSHEDTQFVPEVVEQTDDSANARGPVLSKDQLSLVGMGLVGIPTDIGPMYGEKVKQLDFSYNKISKIENLEKFKSLQSLVLDNNEVLSEQKFPILLSLHTLCVNNNNIDDLKAFLDCLAKSCPNLTYLSMLKNPACPNYFVGKDFEDYQRYRYYVLYRLKKLKFLDSSSVTSEEMKEAVRVGPYNNILKPDANQYVKKPEQAPADEEYQPLATESAPEGVGSARLGTSNYVYFGKHSEGNRFIMNEDL